MSTTLKPLQYLLRALPDRLHNPLFSRLCTHLLRGQPIAKKLENLNGKLMQLTFTDTGNSWRFRFEAGALKADLNNHRPVDVHIKGRLKSFLLLATHNEDPDTLFFNQELSLQGNTEDGLYLRNILDAMEFDTNAHLQSVFGNPLAGIIAPIIKRIQPGARLHALGKSLL